MWQVTFAEKLQMRINSLKKQKHWYLIHNWSKTFKGTFVNRGFSSLHGGSLKITLTVPLKLESFSRNQRHVKYLGTVMSVGGRALTPGTWKNAFLWQPRQNLWCWGVRFTKYFEELNRFNSLYTFNIRLYFILVFIMQH